MKGQAPPDERLALTEQRNPLSEDIDVKSSLEIVEIINREDARVARAVYDARASIATAIEWVARAFWSGGRLFYVGAGTSGRLGQLDAAECPPTFGVSGDLVQAVVAGGSKALVRAVEGAEDDEERGARDLGKRKPTARDIVIAISSGAATPYVAGALRQGRESGAKTVLITCTPLAERGDFVDLVISLLTGPEILTGSTRMKAGTATKMALNMITTGAMIRTGRTYGNLMVDLSCSNRKLLRRGVRILRDVTLLPEKPAKALLLKAQNHVKTALAMGILGVSSREATRLLRENQGFLRRVFDRPHRRNPKIGAVLLDMDGTILQYELPTGFSTWAALGWAFGIYERMEDWVDRYRRGEMTHDGIWEACAREIEGQTFAQVRDVLFPCADAPPYSRGFQDCVKVLREHYRIGIVTSGITLVSEEIKRSLELDFEVSNTLGVSKGRFDGTCSVGVHFDRKLDAVKTKAKELNLDLKEICFVGDSPNDIETLKAVGLPVAYNPKTPEVIEAARGNVIGDFLQLPKLIERFQPRTT